ncbi:MAG: TAXI family TRAP transporter solute-binding subunit [Defluviicoccus sp.]|nr:TAXI family TRAP transporter solute-binding subunit [Defluviicoccus sp.]MDE0385909.1 TAXI family TRAP transporter solute-binding subunit [Defluviicoccus sp.]
MKLLATTAIAAAVVAAGASAQTVSMGTNPQGSLAYSAGAGVAKVAIENAGVKMRVVPQGGPVVTLPLLNDGELDFTISVSVVTAFSISGGAMFKGRKQENVRVVASLFPLVVGMFVRNDSPFKTIADLRGKRLPSRYTKQKISGLFSQAQLATAGIGLDDVTGVPVPNGVRGVQDFMEGKVDAANWSLSSGKTRQAHAAVGGIRVLSLEMNDKTQAIVRKIAPGAVIGTIQPQPLYPGVMGPTNVLIAPFIVNASTKTPDETVYKVVKALHANKAKLVSVHKSFGQFDPAKINLDIGLPYHEGSKKFFKEAGLM